MVRLTTRATTMDHDIWLPFMKPYQLTADRVMVQVDCVIRSNNEWLFGNLFINFIHALLPVGGGWARYVEDLMMYLTNKQCLIQISCKADNLCCARAIITAKPRIGEHPHWNSIRQACNIQTCLAQHLNQEAEIPEGTMYGKEEWAKFQKSLGLEYQLLIYSREYFNIYSSPQFAEKHLSLPC